MGQDITWPLELSQVKGKLSECLLMEQIQAFKYVTKVTKLFWFSNGLEVMSNGIL